MDTTEKSPTVLSLCPGLLLGLDRGFEAALGRKPRTVAYVEIEAFIVANLIAGMEEGVLDAVPVWSNLKTFPWSLFRGKIDWFLGGYPCQPFSNAGNRLGTEDTRHLWPYIAEGIRAVRPMGCFFENVSGHLTLGYESVRRDLQSMGYRVEEGIFSAEEVGAPHRRERLFILAILGDNTSERLQESGLAAFRELYPEKRERIHNRPKQPSYELANTCFYSIQKRKEFGRLWTEFKRTSKELANNNNKRLQRLRQCDRSKGWQKSPRFFRGSRNIWPSKPGQSQFSWEEPHAIEPGMGCTVNGYNFREDLLRGEGNGVVWQTAKLAFRTLLKKHLKSI